MSRILHPVQQGLGHQYWIDRLVQVIDASHDSSFLRPEQQQAVIDIRNGLAEKRPQKALVDRPTQSGKTPIYIRLLQLLEASGTMPRVLLVTPYRRLVEDARKEFVKFGTQYDDGHPLVDIGAWHAHEKKLRTVTGTTWRSADILTDRGLLNPDDIDILILDEAHMGQTELRRKIRDRFKNALIMGFTATPAYSIEKTLEGEFVVVHRLPVADAIEQGVISPFRSLFLKGNVVNLDDVRLRGGDYDLEQIERLIDTGERTHQFIDFYQNGIDPETGKPVWGRTGYINTVTIDRANSIAEQFNQELGHLTPKGVRVAAAIHSDQDPKEQEKVFEDFKAGRILLLVQIRLAGLGLSHKKADICFNDAPSLSPVEVAQRAGRIMAIDEINSEKCSLVIEPLDTGRGRKIPLLYGEVVGPGVGYKYHSRNHVAAETSENIVSGLDEIADLIVKRISMRSEAGKEFSSVYPKLIRRAEALGIKSLNEFWLRTEVFHSRHFLGKEKIGEGNFKSILHGVVNPWAESNTYRPLAIAIAGALGVHPRLIFGAPEELNKLFDRKRFSYVTQQNKYITALMRRAHNPLTGRKGLSQKDVQDLASTDLLKRNKLSGYINGNGKQVAFNLQTGEAKTWALDLAAILDLPVEEVFKYEAMQFRDFQIKSYSGEETTKHLYRRFGQDLSDRENPIEYPVCLPRRLPMDDALPLEMALEVEDSPYDMENAWEEKKIHDYVSRAMTRILLPREERFIRSYWGFDSNEEKTFGKISETINATIETGRQTIERARKKLFNYDKRFALNYSPDSYQLKSDSIQAAIIRIDRQIIAQEVIVQRFKELNYAGQYRAEKLLNKIIQERAALEKKLKRVTNVLIADDYYRPLRPLLNLPEKKAPSAES